MTAKILQLAAMRTARAAEVMGETFARTLRDVLRDTERRLGPLITEVSAGSRTAIVRAAQAHRTRIDIRRALEEAGYSALADTAYGVPLDRMAAKVLTARRLAQQSADLTAPMTTKLDALRVLHTTDLLDEGEQVARELWQATVRGVFGSRMPSRILADLGDILDSSEATITTLYDTSLSIYGRQVEALQAGDDQEAAFAFMGPADDVTRPFCRQHLGKVYTREEIDALDNGQLDNVFLTGGGYNCRHSWMEVSKFSELRDLQGTRHRVPEVQGQLDEIAA